MSVRIRASCPEHPSQTTGCAPCAEAFRRWQVLYRLDCLRGVPRMEDVTGTQRRVRALAVTGWSYPQQAEALGLPTRTVQALAGAEDPRVTVRVADLVRGLYVRKAGTPGRSPRTRNEAARKGWPHPDAWDGVDMDDPAAAPLAPVPLDPRELDAVLVLHDLEHLIRHGATWASLRERVGLSPRAVERRLLRAGRRDLLVVLVRSSGHHAKADHEDQAVAS